MPRAGCRCAERGCIRTARVHTVGTRRARVYAMSDAWVSCAYGDGDVDEKLLRLGYARRLLGIGGPFKVLGSWLPKRRVSPIRHPTPVDKVEDESDSSEKGKTHPNPQDSEREKRERDISDTAKAEEEMKKVREYRRMTTFFGKSAPMLIADLKSSAHPGDKELSRAITRHRYAAWSVLYKKFRDPSPLQQMKWYDSLAWIRPDLDTAGGFFASNLEYAMDRGYNQEYHNRAPHQRMPVNVLAVTRGRTYDTQLPVMVVEFRRTSAGVTNFRRILYGVFVLEAKPKPDGAKKLIPWRLLLKRLISGASRGLTDSASAELAYSPELAKEVNDRCADDIAEDKLQEPVAYATWPQWKRKKATPNDRCAQSDDDIAKEMKDLIYADFADNPFDQDFTKAPRRYITEVYPVAFEMSRFPDGSAPMLWGALGLDDTSRAKRQSLVKNHEDESSSLYKLDLNSRNKAAAEKRDSRSQLQMRRAREDQYTAQKRQEREFREAEKTRSKQLAMGNTIHALQAAHEERQRLEEAVADRARQRKELAAQ